jgi:hypothetical protein
MAKPFPDKTRSLVLGAALALGAACTGDTPVAPSVDPSITAQLASRPSEGRTNVTLATLRSVTARYHNLDAALADGFVFLHGCEVRPGEGAVGTVYVHIGRLMDGVADPSLPDALVYEPARNGGERPTLVAVEFAIPYALWPEETPPTFLGAEFQPEDEFGVFGLHAWVWRNNPEGMFAEANPHVSCGDE